VIKFTFFCVPLLFQFLANDVTLVTSYGYCQSLKINDRREQCRVCLTICEAGVIFCEMMGGGVHRDTETLTLSAAQTHTANVMGVRPRALKCFAFASVDLLRMPALCT